MPKYTVDITSYDSFKSAVNGKGFDMDGYYGLQCWDGVDLFYDQLGATLSTGGTGVAKGCWTNTSARQANTLANMIQITDVRQLKRGDIIVLNSNLPSVGTTGHIAFCDADYVSSVSMPLLGQNQGAGANGRTGKPFNVTNFNITSFLGAFRYLPWGQPTPPPTPTEKKKKKHFPWAIAWRHWDAFKR